MSQQSSQRLRLQDVAERLGVSAKTVSNAYRRPDQLRPELRQQIFDTAADMGYRGPNAIAAGLRRKTHGPIGVLYANALAYAFDDPNTNALLGGLSSDAEAAGRGLLLLPGSAGQREGDEMLDRAIVDGIIASSLPNNDPLLASAIRRRMPLVVIDQPRPTHLAVLGAPQTPWVGIDDRAAADAIAEHLLKLGHRHIGIVSFALRVGPTPLRATQHDIDTATLAVTADRLAGYRAAIERHGLDWSRVPITQSTDSTPGEGHRGAAALLDLTPTPTALICLSDRLAEGALAAAADRHLDVSDDLSVVGFDDAPHLAEHLGLTTIRQLSRDKGRVAAAALLAQLTNAANQGQGQGRTVLQTQLIIRGSTASPPAHAR